MEGFYHMMLKRKEKTTTIETSSECSQKLKASQENIVYVITPMIVYNSDYFNINIIINKKLGTCNFQILCICRHLLNIPNKSQIIIDHNKKPTYTLKFTVSCNANMIDFFFNLNIKFSHDWHFNNSFLLLNTEIQSSFNSVTTLEYQLCWKYFCWKLLFSFYSTKIILNRLILLFSELQL